MLFKKEQLSEEQREQFDLGHKKWEKQCKTVKKHLKNINFLEQIPLFLEQFARITSESLMSLFFKEGQEQFTHGHSFLKRDKSDLLTIVFFKRGTRAPCL